ncbi:MAG TPA: phage tail protein I [Anaerolineales bacterium]
MAQEFIFRLQIQGIHESWTYEIPAASEELVIGRQAGVDVLLEHQQVSRKHAVLRCTDTECQIVDLKSANGTRVNGEKLTPHAPVILKPGDSIQIGAFNLDFEQVSIEAPLEEAELPEPPPPFEEEPLLGAEPEIALPPPDFPLFPPPPRFDPSQPPPGLTFRSERLLSYLPGIYHTDFMANFLAIFESVLFPIEWQIDNFDLFLDPDTAPTSFLPWLANWFEIGFDSTWTEAQRRTFLKEAYSLYARTGTRDALCRLLEIYCGYPPEIDDQAEDLPPHTFRVKLRPTSSAERKSIERLINVYKPIHTACILEVQS